MGAAIASIPDPRGSAPAGEHERTRALALLRRWGWNATGFQTLEQGFEYFFDGDDSCVAYIDTGSAWVVAGAPIAPFERLREVVRSFETAARKASRRICFFAVEARFPEAVGLPSMLVGEQPIWNPQDWNATIAGRRSVREQLRRARAKGVRVRVAEANEVLDRGSPARGAIESLIHRWLGTRSMAHMSFLVDIQLFAFAEERRYFVAERENAVVGFLVLVPVFARTGWLFEDLVRDPRAPNGTVELLVDEAMRSIGRDGSTYATLRLAPLSGPIAPWLGRVRRWSSALYDFEGVRSFKSKLSPHAWDPVLLAYPEGSSANVALYDALRAFAGGSFVGFGLRTLLRGPAIVIRALALLLIPWTLLLATADPAWFPSQNVQHAWVSFDIALAVALLSLSVRWRHWLGVLLATAVTADALLTGAQALFYNLPRAVDGATGFAIAIACIGPLLGAVTLWGAVARTAVTQRKVRGDDDSGGRSARSPR